MQLEIADGQLEIRLSRAQKIFGLMRDVSIPFAEISAVELVENPLREAMGSGLKAGLRVPYVCYVARTIRLDEMFVVRRGVPGLSLSLHGHGHLQRVLVSTPEAQALVERLKQALPAGR
ncbi:MAG TPA: hypothetical protein VGG08_03530 [Solirubrobacteraceae bacterium]|jgi:hypothetical protein